MLSSIKQAFEKTYTNAIIYVLGICYLGMGCPDLLTQIPIPPSLSCVCLCVSVFFSMF